MSKIYIICGSYSDFEIWCQTNSADDEKPIYVMNADQIRELKDINIKFLESAQAHHDIELIMDEAIKHKKPCPELKEEEYEDIWSIICREKKGNSDHVIQQVKFRSYTNFVKNLIIFCDKSWTLIQFNRKKEEKKKFYKNYILEQTYKNRRSSIVLRKIHQASLIKL